MTGADPRDSGVSGRGVQLLELWALSKLPGERMLPATRSHEQGFHRSQCFKGAGEGDATLVQEPGLDRHEWETQWEQLQPLVQDSPAEALPELDRLLEEMLAARGFPLDDPVMVEGEEPEVVRDFRAARELMQRIERGLDDDPGDVAQAINNYREVYEFLIADRRAP